MAETDRNADAAIVPVVLCGGSGTRLWPASRRTRPKQFLPLFGEHSPFQDTLLRVSADGFAKPIVIANNDHRFLAAEQARTIGVEITIVLEPEARDSGPGLAAAALYVARTLSPQTLVLALAADHRIEDVDGFRRTVLGASSAAGDGRIVTFGIQPDRPATGFGYIEPGERLAGPAQIEVRAARRFVEKPDLETAKAYLAEGYLWNSGNFLCRAGVLIEEYRSRDAETLATVSTSVDEAVRDLDFVRLDPAAFARAAKRSIDYAIMETSDRIAVATAGFDWSDIGDWNALRPVLDRDGHGNAVHGTCVALDAANNVVWSNGALVALSGVDDLVVAVTEDAVLVTHRTKGDLMKDLVEKVRQADPVLVEEHLQSFRPWGNYRSLDKGSRHQVKRIVVKPGAQLSLQHHHHRSEHWIVVRGTAKVTIDETILQLSENQSTYIPLGSLHRLENPGKIDLELIEVQTGSYLGEDDIVRHEDIYARAGT
ncbi:mannose-1-phosphate guanylyltransferase/mannose-6-phosphate isomerase [Fulvimarina sp. 2208YS6-2-32]|uniref:mannose-1-phosphate guanylyltransferase n=1 Tax=Fulvimarina uroteuthidis TaxID=3098149 RepID=A0ABU5I3E3_9HYPH|nr:mannose-1-phosphate guanylyltransferase/mannose-6-phosphate isomerase [Fulvimarina sp. 2208YS6-2-32]MDY8109298.1 mannose-1-phosphate guanylyltransferase/mannose-6-phosphate isomerase [Fulvimarina sp. 2208YS6-2-32]